MTASKEISPIEEIIQKYGNPSLNGETVWQPIVFKDTTDSFSGEQVCKPVHSIRVSVELVDELRTQIAELNPDIKIYLKS